MSRALCAADGAECVVGARVGGGLGVADSGEACERLGLGGTAADALAHAGRGELCRTGKLVGLSVLVGGHTVRQEYVRGKAEVGFPALVADEPPLRVLGDAPVHTGADWLTDAGCGLVGILATCPLVMLETDPV